MNSIYKCTCCISLTNKWVYICLVRTLILTKTAIWFSTYIEIGILCVSFKYFVRCGCTRAIATRCYICVWWTKYKCSSPSSATSTGFKAIYFVRGTAILFNILVFTILIGKAPQKGFTWHTTSYVWNPIFTLFGAWKENNQSNFYEDLFILQLLCIYINCMFIYNAKWIPSPSTEFVCSTSVVPWFPPTFFLSFLICLLPPRIGPLWQWRVILFRFNWCHNL